MSGLSLSLSGAHTALVTPFTPGGAKQVDKQALEKLVEAQIAGGIRGLVPCGTTGETPTLSAAEQLDVIRTTVGVAKGRALVIAGTGSFDTQKTIEASQRAVEAGADAVMVVMPYYSKPSQEGLFLHTQAVAKAVSCPIVLYNIPGRTQSDMLPDTTSRVLDACPNVVAVKEATGNIVRCQELKRRHGQRVTVLSGDDSLTLAMLAVGGSGVISVTSNVYPKEVSEVVRLGLEGKWEAAQKAHFAILPVHDAMFIEPNPGPVKAALAHTAQFEAGMRLPLAPPTEACVKRVSEIIGTYEAQRSLVEKGALRFAPHLRVRLWRLFL